MQPVRTAASLLFWLLLTTAGYGATGPGLETCEALFAAGPKAEAAARCFYEQSRHPERTAAATHRLRELLTQHPEFPWLSFYLGSVRWGQPAEAEALYRTAAGRFAEHGEARGEFRARINLHDRLIKQGHAEEAALEKQRAIRVAKVSGNPDLMANAEILEARALLSAGQDLGRASQLLAEAHRTLFPRGSDSLRKQWLFASGEANIQIGRHNEARESFLQLADLAAGTDDRYETAAAEYGLLRVLMSKAAEQPNDSGQAAMLAQARTTLAAAQVAQDANTEFLTQFILGLLTRGAESEEHFAACRKKSANPAEACFCLGGRARKLAEEKDPQPAQEALREALAVAKQSEDPWFRTFFAGDRMRVSWRIRPRQQALADSWAALDEIEALRSSQGPASRAGLFSTWSDNYYWFSGTLLARPDRGPADIAEAFVVTERLRGRTLLEKLADIRPEPLSREVLHQRLQGIEAAIQNVERRAAGPQLPPSERKYAGEDQKALASEKVRIERQLAAPGTAAPRGPSPFVPLREVQAALAPDEALLSFQVAPWKDWTNAFGGGSWLTVVTPATTRAYRLPGREELRLLVAPLMSPLERYEESPQETGYLVDLYEKLLAHALRELPKKIQRLVILPDDDLHRIPFAALHPAGAPPLRHRYQITVAPSATLWREWRRHQPPPARIPALVLADPIGLGGLPPLPLTAEEGKAAVKALGGGSVLRTREEASEAFLKSADLRPYEILVLATHSVLEDDPERSSVRLTPSGKGKGHFEVAQILQLKMDGKVVVLSTCESAAGPILRGEGVMSLARAFFAARAHTVVGSLWPIAEGDGELLFKRFYSYLGKGASVAAALRAAQGDRIADSAPLRAWAGFVVLGDGDLVPLPGGRKASPISPWALALAGAALLASFALWIWRRRLGRG